MTTTTAARSVVVLRRFDDARHQGDACASTPCVRAARLSDDDRRIAELRGKIADALMDDYRSEPGALVTVADLAVGECAAVFTGPAYPWRYMVRVQ